jgi:hypothetical protein
MVLGPAAPPLAVCITRRWADSTPLPPGASMMGAKGGRDGQRPSERKQGIQKPKADKPKGPGSAYKLSQGKGRPAVNPFAKKT